MAEVEGGSGYATTPGSGGQPGVRSFFIVDLSRLRQETDTLEGAKVVYIPENEFKKNHYNHRCSQLIGLALCTRDFIGKTPSFLRLKGCSYATKQLDQNYLICLAGRPEEPGECVVQLLDHLLELFHFYYHSSEDVMNTSKNDWEVFTTRMKLIFQKINEFVFSDQHSVPAMFRPLPYLKVDRASKNQSRLFLLASRLLRSCQQHKPIVGGCILHNREIVCNQLPPGLLEKVQLVGGDGVELNTKSILEENVAPESVWVLEVFLTPSEVEELEESQQDLRRYRNTYQEMKPNPGLMNSAHTWRFPTSVQPRIPPRRRSHAVPRHPSSRRSTTPMQDHDPADEDYYNLPPITITDAATESASGLERSVSIHSEAALTDFGARYSSSKVLKKRRKVRESVSPQAVAKGGRREKGGERGGSRGVKVGGDGNRVMPQLHSASHAPRDPDYDDPDEFLKDSSKASPDMARPVSSAPTHTNTTSASPPTPPPSTAPISTPPASTSSHGADKPPEASSPRVIMTGSSAEEERFTTPSPTFPSLPSFPHLSESSAVLVNSTPRFETSSGVDRSNSFQTADESSDRSLRLSPSDHRQEVPGRARRRDKLPNGGAVRAVDRVGGLDEYAEEEDHSPPPPLPLRAEDVQDGSQGKKWSVYDSPPSRPPKKVLPFVGRREDSDSEDFVDSDFLDQMLQEVEREKETELQKGKGVSGGGEKGGGGGGGGVREREGKGEQWMDRKNQPLPKPPAEDGEAATLTNSTPLLPKASQHAQAKVNQPSALSHQNQLAGNSGEFTVDCPPAVPPRGCSAGIDVPPPPLPKGRAIELGNDDVIAKRAEVGDQLDKELDQVKREGSRGTVPSLGSDQRTSLGYDKGEEGGMKGEGGKGGGGEASVRGSEDREKRRSRESTSVDPDHSVEEGDKEGRAREEEKEEEEEEVAEKGRKKLEEEQEEEEGMEEEEEREREEAEGRREEEEERHEGKGSSSSSLLASAETLTSDEGAGDKREAKSSTLKYEDQAALPLGSESEAKVEEGGTKMHLHVDGAGELYDQPPDIVYGHQESINMSIDMPYTPEVTLNSSVVAKAQELQSSASNSESTQNDLLLESVDMRSRTTTLAGDLLPHNATLRGRAGSNWLQTLGRQLQAPEACPSPKLETRCLYVQRHAKTVVVLLAESGLHTNHVLLTTLWQSLLTQLIVLEGGLATRERDQQPRSRVSSIAVYQGADKHCTAHPASAVYHFRHALRRTHLEYAKNPELLQVTLCKEHCRMMSQNVMERETFCNHARQPGSDTFIMTSSLVKFAKQQIQTPHGNPPTLFL